QPSSLWKRCTRYVIEFQNNTGFRPFLARKFRIFDSRFSSSFITDHSLPPAPCSARGLVVHGLSLTLPCCSLFQVARSMLHVRRWTDSPWRAPCSTLPTLTVQSV